MSPRLLPLFVFLLGLTVCSVRLHAQFYWDTNGPTAGAGGATPAGTWGVDNFWSSSATGAATTTTWTSGSVAVFSAGSDATGTYAITISGTQTIGGLTVEEGTPTFSGGTLEFAAVTNFNIASNTTIASVLTGTGGNLSKSGTGALALSGANTYTGGTTVTGGLLHLTSNGSITHAAADTLVGGNAELRVNGGADLTNQLLRVGFNTNGGSMNIEGLGTTVTSNTYTYVGEAGTGSLNIGNGGSLTTADISIGNNTGGTGVVTVTGANSSLTQTATTSNPGIFVGSGGNGSLIINNGAQVSSFRGVIGNNPGGTGAVQISGTGSTWNTQQLIVGNTTSATLTVSDGGKIAVAGGNLVLGNQTGGTANVLVGNSGTIEVASYVYVGETGAGSLGISSGGSVMAADISIGNSSGGSGAVTVGGANSSLTQTATTINSGLFVGSAGNGTLLVTDSAQVTSFRGVVGNNPGGTGAVQISGTGSTWTTQQLTVGNTTVGELTVSDGGKITVAGGNLVLGSQTGGAGSLHIGNSFVGGIVDVPTVTTGVGTGDIYFNPASTLASPYFFTRDATAAGTPVTIAGGTHVSFLGGYTVINGTSTYTGSTSITGGTAIADGTNNSFRQLGTGIVDIGSGGHLIMKAAELRNSTLNINAGGRLSGYGVLGNGTGLEARVFSGGVISPGTTGASAVGELSFDDLTLSGGGVYEWNLKTPTGTPGVDWDLVGITDFSTTLHVDSSVTTNNRFTLKVISLDAAGNPGITPGFINQTYKWIIAYGGPAAIDFANGFDPTAFEIDAAAFATNLGDGAFTLLHDTVNHTLELQFIPVPEPSTYALMFTGIALAGLRYRRRIGRSQESRPRLDT